MESISHAIIGIAVAAVSGQPAEWSNPIYVGAVLGAIAPDLDIVFQAFGDMVYLRHHRGFSHSIPGVAIIAGVITTVLAYFMDNTNWMQVLFWTFLGGMSHTLFDILNSYGAQIFAPWSKKRLTLNLLQIFDPVVVVLALGASLSTHAAQGGLSPQLYWLAIGAYLVVRLLMRKGLSRSLHRYFRVDEGPIQGIVLLPALTGITTWDFLIETDQEYLVGQAVMSRSTIKINRHLAKSQYDGIVQAALESKLGKLFQELTPYWHVSYCLEEGKHIVKFLDLRYRMKNDFMHTGTLVMDKERDVVEAVFHPFHANRNVKI